MNRSLCGPEAEGVLLSRWRTAGAIMASTPAGVCGIRYAPAKGRADGNPYYDWIRCGLELCGVLGEWSWCVIECFPTASWSRWGHRKGPATRGAWSSKVLAAFGLIGLPDRLGQDARDAIGAALTARAHARHETEAFGEIVVPARLAVARV